MNLKKGIHELEVSDADGVISSFTRSIFKGFHVEGRYLAASVIGGTTTIISVFNEQLYSETIWTFLHEPVDDEDSWLNQVILLQKVYKLNGTTKLNFFTATAKKVLLNKS